MNGRTRLLAALVALLVAGTLVAAVLLAIHYERNQQEEAQEALTAGAAAVIRAQLRETEQSLTLLAANLRKTGDTSHFDRVAAELLGHDGSLLRIELRRRDGTLISAIDAAAPRPRLGPEQRAQLGFETGHALGVAIAFERTLYSRSHFVPFPSAGGFEVIDLVVPIGASERDALIAVYSLPRLLDRMLPANLLQSQQVYLTETDGTFVARASSGLHGTGVYTAQVSLDLPGLSLQLHTNSVRRSPDLIPNLLTALLIVATLALAGSGAMLWRDWRLRARAERALHGQYAFRKAMEDSLFTGLLARDLDGRITYVNPAFCRMTGLPASALVGCLPPMPYWIPGHACDGSRHMSPQDPCITAGPGYETEFIRSNGQRFPVLIFEAPLIDEHGHHSGSMGSILDLSEQKRVEELNRRQRDKLQANARMALLGEVATTLSHELNQPLAAITSYAAACENLLQGPTRPATANIQAALARIRAQSERAGQVIHSVQDFARRKRLAAEPLPVGKLLRSAEPLIRLQANKIGAKLHWLVDAPIPLVGDRMMLEQVLLNLTRNAFEAMSAVPQAQRLLEIAAGSAGTLAAPRVWLEVRDRGPGVPVELHAQLFSAFFTTKPDGLGIGLSLCRTVIESHGGSLRHQRREGGGAIFRLELPAAAGAGAGLDADLGIHRQPTDAPSAVAANALAQTAE